MSDQPVAKRSVSRRQIGALPFRRADGGTLEVLLVTGRRTGRWVIPKGWPSRRLDDAAAAAREALEEAGVIGSLSERAVGSYRYAKEKAHKIIQIEVAVYLLSVETVGPRWIEQDERARAWFSPSMAAALVHEPQLGRLIRELLSDQRDEVLI